MFNKKLKKNILYLILFSLLFSFTINSNAKCNSEYMKKLIECKSAIKNGSYKSLDFVCVQDTSDVQLYQIILDQLFKKVDLDAKNSLEFLTENKDYYFRSSKNGEEVPNFLNAIDDIDNDFGELGRYYNRYKTICDKTLIKNFTECNDVSHPVTIKSWSNQECFNMAKIKLNIYKNVAYNQLLLNKLQLRKDNRTTFMQVTRKSYSYLLKLFDININYLERIAFKWKIKIKNGYLP